MKCAQAGCAGSISDGYCDVCGLAQSSAAPATATATPAATAPAVEADLWDGTGRLTVLWLGRRRIAGITPGRHVVVHGRVILRGEERLMVNPRYELLPTTSE